MAKKANSTKVKLQRNSALAAKEWTFTIRPASGWLDIHLGELWRYKDLILLFIRRDFIAIYKQTILGPLWYLIQPIMTTLVFTIIFTGVARLPTDGLPPVLFYLSGVIVWRYFADSLQKTSNTFVSNAHLFGKIYFPRLTVPIAVVISNLISFAIQMLLLVCVIFYFLTQDVQIKIPLTVLLLPLLVFQMALLALGCGIIISSLTTRYRDLAQLVGFGIQLWMFATPVVYPASIIPEKWRWSLTVNPMASIMETFRGMIFGSGTLDIRNILTSLAITMLILVVGIILFSRIEKNFMDTV